MQKWEYLTHRIRIVDRKRFFRELEKYLADAGEQGWELVSSHYYMGDAQVFVIVMIFKRPLETPTAI
jgi:hypothetical protein